MNRIDRVLRASVLVTGLMSAFSASAAITRNESPRETIHRWSGLSGTWQYQILDQPVCLKGPYGVAPRCYNRVDLTSPTLAVVIHGRWQLVGEHFLGGQNYTDEGDPYSDSNFKTGGNHIGAAYIATVGASDLRFELRRDARTRQYCVPVRFPFRLNAVCERHDAVSLGATVEFKTYLTSERTWFADVSTTYWRPIRTNEAFTMAKGDARWLIGYDLDGGINGRLEAYVHQGVDIGTGDRYWGLGLRYPF